MTTMELDARRMELIRDIMETDNIEILKKMKRYFLSLSEQPTKEESAPYTAEELNARIDEAEAEIDAGIPGVSHKELMQKIRNKIAQL